MNYIISDLEEDVEEAERAKEQVQMSASGYSVDKYDDYRAEITNYRSSIEFYEAIVSDLEEFLTEVDDQVKFTRDTKFEYDDQMITEILNLTVETEELKSNCSINIADRDYSPYGPFERGNFLHQGSSEEELIDLNDYMMEPWAEELNKCLGKLIDSTDEIERLHKLYFEDITLNDWKSDHDEHDGMADEAYDFFHNNILGNTIRGLYNGGSNLVNDAKSIINTATHPIRWPSVINSFLQTLGYVANPSNWYNIGSALIAGFLMTVEEEGFGYALGNGLFFIGEEIATEGVITEMKLADSGIDVVKFAERSDDAIDAVNSIKRIDNIENTVTRIDLKTIEVTAKDGTKYQYSGRHRNKKLTGSSHPVTGVAFDENGFPVFDCVATYELPKADYTLTSTQQFEKLNKQLYTDIESGVVENPFPEGLDYSSLKNGKMPKDSSDNNYFTWHHNQEPGVMQLVDAEIHADTGHTGGAAIWGNPSNAEV